MKTLRVPCGISTLNDLHDFLTKEDGEARDFGNIIISQDSKLREIEEVRSGEWSTIMGYPVIYE